MKRDWDVIRDVLLEVEELSADDRRRFSYSESDGRADAARVEHALLLWRGGFIKAIDAGSTGGAALLCPDLTWQGHDLLDTLRSKPVWERIKSTAKEKGIELTFDAVKALGQMALDYVLTGG
ncbi:MAG: DUF2513 domain-containing protein [Vitreoscilla sp.]|nr:DUF2513 domain-containing protein [Vitreoscilla sp.]